MSQNFARGSQFLVRPGSSFSHSLDFLSLAFVHLFLKGCVCLSLTLPRFHIRHRIVLYVFPTWEALPRATSPTIL